MDDFPSSNHGCNNDDQMSDDSASEITRIRKIHEFDRYGFNSRDTDKTDQIGGFDLDKNVW
jgi:hypothetical protein